MVKIEKRIDFKGIKVDLGINDNLQQQSVILFSSFIAQIVCPSVSLSSICNIKYGKNLPTKKLENVGYNVFGGNGIIGKYSQYLYDKPQILVSCRGAASGNILVSYPKSFVTNNSLVLELNDYRYFEFMKQYLLLNPLYSYATGSAQPQITVENIKDVLVPYPEFSEISKLTFLLELTSKKCYQTIVENEKLVSLRNELLPKLMAGRIDVSNIYL